MLSRLRHDPLVRGDDEQDEVDALRPCDHRPDELLVPRHVHEGERLPSEAACGEAELDRDPPRLLLRQPIGIGPVSARTRELFPWSMWPAVPTRTRRMGADYGRARAPRVANPALWAKGRTDGLAAARGDGERPAFGAACTTGCTWGRARPRRGAAPPPAVPDASVRHDDLGRLRSGDDLGPGFSSSSSGASEGKTTRPRDTVVSTAENPPTARRPSRHSRATSERVRGEALTGVPAHPEAQLDGGGGVAVSSAAKTARATSMKDAPPR